MGTNYYVASNLCQCCDRYDRACHIGKSSHGWAFSFRGYRQEGLVSWQAWRVFLKDQIIKDEYGDTISYEDFVDLIETVKAPGYINRATGIKNLLHNEQGKIGKHPWFNDVYDWDDPQGYSFTSREFS